MDPVNAKDRETIWYADLLRLTRLIGLLGALTLFPWSVAAVLQNVYRYLESPSKPFQFLLGYSEFNGDARWLFCAPPLLGLAGCLALLLIDHRVTRLLSRWCR